MPHTWVYHTPPTKSSHNNMVKYDEDDDNIETGEEDMRNVESDEKERDSGHFVDMCDTENNDETDTDGSSKTAEYEENIRPRHFCGKSYRTVTCCHYAAEYCKFGDRCSFIHDGPLTRKGKSRTGRNSASAHASSSCDSVMSEEADRKDATK